MEEQNEIGGVGPLELLSTRLNIHAAGRAGMGLTAWANKHSTWHDGRNCPAVDKAQQARPNGGRRGSRVLSTMNQWNENSPFRIQNGRDHKRGRLALSTRDLSQRSVSNLYRSLSK